MMRCLFCKINSANSRSVEHIIPESLGNKNFTLRRGIVCDKCNNYFAREVEKPFLASPAITSLRFHQAVPNKKGRVPPITGIVTPNHPAILYRDPDSLLISVSLDEKGIRRVLSEETGTLLLPLYPEPPSDIIISRFLAKAALEAMAERLQKFPEGLDYLVNESQLDPIRRHAREGIPRQWPYFARRIYGANRHFIDEDGNDVQTIHESDILVTPNSEYFYILAIFGLELAINYGGPEIDGYLRWLEINGDRSPLYCNKNS